MITLINLEDGVVISVVVDGVVAWSTIPPRLQPARSYFQICGAAGWYGDFETEEEARSENWEGRSIREVMPTDPHYKPRWFPKPKEETIAAPERRVNVKLVV